MKMKTSLFSEFFSLFKVMIVMLIVTLGLILLLSFAVFRFRAGDFAISVFVFFTYFFSVFTGGFLLGKIKKEKKFLWGLLIGFLYFLLLFFFSFAANHALPSDPHELLPALCICLFGGMLGGMLS